MGIPNPTTANCGGGAEVDFSVCGQGQVTLPGTLYFTMNGGDSQPLSYSDSMPGSGCEQIPGFAGYPGWSVVEGGFAFWWAPGRAAPDSGSSNNVWVSYNPQTCEVFGGQATGSECGQFSFDPFLWTAEEFTITE
jgi:hypothetical protein